MKRIIAVPGIAALHLLLTRVTISFTEVSVAAHAFEDTTSLLPGFLVWVTKILSFPIITLSLYPRQWYPGNLIVIPFLVNSLLWAAVIYFPVTWFRKKRKR